MRAKSVFFALNIVFHIFVRPLAHILDEESKQDIRVWDGREKIEGDGYYDSGMDRGEVSGEMVRFT